VAEGQKVAGEIKAQAHTEAQHRLERANDEIARENEKAKEILKQRMIALALRAAEKILRQKLDDASQRQLAAEFVDEVGALR
jgi:F-type H+-transporting ATPase subunit b